MLSQQNDVIGRKRAFDSNSYYPEAMQHSSYLKRVLIKKMSYKCFNNFNKNSIELVLIKLAYETNHQCFDQDTLAFIRVIQQKRSNRATLVI